MKVVGKIKSTSVQNYVDTYMSVMNFWDIAVLIFYGVIKILKCHETQIELIVLKNTKFPKQEQRVGKYKMMNN